MLGIKPQMNNMDCSRRRNSTNFGMAVKIKSSAQGIIKKQAVQLTAENKNAFLDNLRRIIEEQKENPVDIILRKSRIRNALVAKIVDSPAGQKMGAVKIRAISQPMINKTGDLNFLDTAGREANKLNEINKEVKGIVDSAPSVTEVVDYRTVHRNMS